LAGEARDGWFDGLPFPLLDSRPQGFLGRNFAHRHALDLAVSENPEDWSESDIAYVLATQGHDQPGNLILGEAAYRRFLESRASAEERTLVEAQIASAYPQLASDALAQGVVGASAGGEFPKFTARRTLDGEIVDVIVKFSGSDESAAVQRWSDLLVCEHLALEAIAQHLDIAAARSNLRRYGGRTFLEVQRFDRHGALGRSAVCTLTSINAALIGAPPGPWQKVASRLSKSGWLAADDVDRITCLWWFGRLIANTDMHEGNLAFRPGLTLAPVYDMLPMAYAPLRGGELPVRRYQPELPLPDETAGWQLAAPAAILFWQTCAADQRISAPFREVCVENRAALEKIASARF
jgi:hypothetical protein